MGTIARLTQLLRTNLHDLVSSAEDPVKVLQQVAFEMHEHRTEVQKLCAVFSADGKRLAKQAELARSNATEWERRALLVLESGNEALLNEVLARKAEHTELASACMDRADQRAKSVKQLKTALRALNGKIEQAMGMRRLLIMQENRAGTCDPGIEHTDPASALRAFDRLCAKIAPLEADAMAGAEIHEQSAGGQPAQLNQPEPAAGADDEELALRRMLMLEPAPPKAARPEPVAAEPAVAVPVLDEEALLTALAELEAEERKTAQLSVLCDSLGFKGEWRELVHTVLARAHRTYTRSELADAIVDWVIRTDLPRLLDAQGKEVSADQFRRLPALSPADSSARTVARVAARELLTNLAEDRAMAPAIVEAAVRAQWCRSYDDLLPVGNNLRHYLGWVESEAAHPTATIHLIATLAGRATLAKSSALVALATGEVAALWVTLRDRQVIVANSIERLAAQLPPDVARELDVDEAGLRRDWESRLRGTERLDHGQRSR